MRSPVANILPRPAPPRDQRFDWRGYFVEFCRAHGEPVEAGGRLLFRDGWMYSKSSYEGPEWPPPADAGEMDALIVKYWTHRRRTVERDLATWAHKLEATKTLQAAHSLPLQEAVVVERQTSAGPVRRRGYAPFNWAATEQRVRWLRQDLAECDEKLNEIRSFPRLAALLLAEYESLKRQEESAPDETRRTG